MTCLGGHMSAAAAARLTLRPPPGLPHPAAAPELPRQRQVPPGSFYAHPGGRALGPPPGLAAPCRRAADGPWAPGAWEVAPSTRCPSREPARAPGAYAAIADSGSDSELYPGGPALGPPPGLVARCCRAADGPWAPGAREDAPAPSTRCPSLESARAPCANAAIADSGSDSDGPGARPPPGAWSSQGEGAAPRPPGCFGGAGCHHELGKPGVPSAGSAQHHLGLCKPCDFVYRGACREGTSCKFCHLCGPEETQRRKKEKKRQHRAQRQREYESLALVGGPLAGPVSAAGSAAW
ncbi:unnamed protein product [Prorocentrum cordatum]|uniref:C3H1-type domain-containing protein n=1 Tax=Prorocentrum cordatum TaxID=2364126 RepID=A0ABN9W2W2_9DINO|nr:unnamed protein product [Polarella glacialis]